jgi:hypothetical protein
MVIFHNYEVWAHVVTSSFLRLAALVVEVCEKDTDMHVFVHTWASMFMCTLRLYSMFLEKSFYSFYENIFNTIGQ